MNLYDELPNGLFAFDIGSNIGTITQVLLRKQCRVLAFEPQVQLTTNKNYEGATVFNLCVSDKDGVVQFHPCKANTLSSCNPEWKNGCFKDKVAWGTPINMCSRSIDSLTKEHGIPNLIKIDVEGYENVVLKGMIAPVDYLIFEYTGGYTHIVEECICHVRRIYGETLTLIVYESTKKDGVKTSIRFSFNTLDAFLAHYRELNIYAQGDLLICRGLL